MSCNVVLQPVMFPHLLVSDPRKLPLFLILSIPLLPPSPHTHTTTHTHHHTHTTTHTPPHTTTTTTTTTFPLSKLFSFCLSHSLIYYFYVPTTACLPWFVLILTTLFLCSCLNFCPFFRFSFPASPPPHPIHSPLSFVHYQSTSLPLNSPYH